MPIAKREFMNRMLDRTKTRKERDSRARMDREMKDMGFEQFPDPAPPLPAATSRASRPDMYPSLVKGMASAQRTNHGYPAGDNVADTNVMPDDRVATSGADHRDRDLDPHGKATRPRKNRE